MHRGRALFLVAPALKPTIQSTEDMSTAPETEKKGPSKKELNKLARKEKRGGGDAAPAEAPAAITYSVFVPKNQALHPLLTRAVELLSRGNRDYAVKYIAATDAALGQHSALYINSECALGDSNIAKFLARSTPALATLSGNGDAWTATQIEQWLEVYAQSLQTVNSALPAFVDQYLATKTYLVGQSLTLADIAVFLALRKATIDVALVNVARWVRLVQSQLPTELFAPLTVQFPSNKAAAQPAAKKADAAETVKEESRDEGGACPALEGAIDGQVVTRFPPEPSGYLHIGHAKAVLLNTYYAQRYHGKLLIRFDDTNPTKEKEEFEENILGDLRTLGVPTDHVSHTSDHFETCERLARQLISDGLGYMDDTEQEVMQAQRMARQESSRRNTSVEENLAIFERMLKGEEGFTNYCLRAKIDMTSVNGTMRDPVLYRHLGGVPHHRTGTRYQAYPTYDFACPIVDSVEGVTHALRTTEYNDRDEQYHWLQNALRLRRVHIHAFGKMNFVNTVLSKRKLTWFVEQGLVEGWSDARFPTVQGCLRRGVDVDALKRFIISQGASRRIITMEWDKFWAENKRVLEEKCPRFMGVSSADAVEVVLDNVAAEEVQADVPVHPQKPELGTRPMTRSNRLLIDQADAVTLAEGEEVTLLRWGNMRIRSIVKEGDQVVRIEGSFDPDATNFSKTKKLTWLAQSAKNVAAEVHEFDHLLRKAKIEDTEDFKDFVNPVTRKISSALVDVAVGSLPAGSVVQLERKGFFRVDVAHGAGQTLQLFAIPDGKAAAKK